MPSQRPADVDLSEVSSVEDDEEIRRDLDDLDVEGTVPPVTATRVERGNEAIGVAGKFPSELLLFRASKHHVCKGSRVQGISFILRQLCGDGVLLRFACLVFIW